MMVNSVPPSGDQGAGPADCLKPMAYAPEGFVEAVDMPGKSFVRAVQWHPEYMAESSIPESVRGPQHAMAREFIEAAAAARSRK